MQVDVVSLDIVDDFWCVSASDVVIFFLAFQYW